LTMSGKLGTGSTSVLFVLLSSEEMRGRRSPLAPLRLCPLSIKLLAVLLKHLAKLRS
jgi:hypothetical protein